MPAAELPADLSASHDLLHALLELSLPGIILFRPLYAADDPATILDLAYVQLNPAAQQMLQLPAQPAETFRTLYPNARETGIFAFYRDTFLSGQPGEYAVNYPYDGLDNFFLLSARRCGELLVVGFTDTATQERSYVEQALRESQAREQAARTEAEAQRQRFYDVLMQLPAQVATYHGPDHVFSFVNQRFSTFVSSSELLGRPVREAAQGAVGQQVFALLDQVYATGEPVFLPELEVLLPQSAPSRAAPLFVNACYLPLRDGHGHLYGVLDFSYDVTEQVLARRQVQQLNQELEVRVAERTRELVATQAAALAAAQRQVQQREDLYQIFEQAPAAILLLREPDHRIEYVNPAYQQLFPELALRGRLLPEAHPTATTSGVLARLDQVFETGEPYVGVERPIELTLTPGQPPQTHYFNYTYQPYREQGRIVGVSLFAYDVTEAALARQLAARQARQFQELYEQAPMAVCILRGPEFIVELANPAILHIWGLTAEQSLGRPRLELIPEASRASLRAVLETAYRTHQPHHVQEFPVVLGRRHTGQPDTGYFNFIYQPLFDAQGQPVALTCVGIEVTEQVLARQAVEATAQRLRLLTDALPVLIGYLDREERYQFTNEAYRTWFNQDPQALLGRTVRDIVGEQAYANAKPYLDRALAGERLDFESQMPYREGFVKYIRTSYVPDMQAGELHGFYTLVTDITEQTLARQQVEQANQELEARVQERTQQLAAAQAATERERTLLQALFAQAPVAIGLFQGEELRITSANALIANLWGYTPEQVVGRPLLEAVPELRGQGFEELLRQVLTTQVPFTGTETPATMLREGELKTTYYNFVYQPLYAADGQVLGVINIAVEVTEQVLARRQVEQLNQTLESRVQERTQQLAEQQTELRRLFAQAPMAIVVLRGPTFIIEQTNEQAELIWGRSAAEVLGRPHFEALPEVAGQGFEELLTGVLQSGEPMVLHEVPIELARTHTGQPGRGYYNIIFKPLRSVQQQIDGIAIMWAEQTDQVLARQQVQDLNQELMATNEELNESNRQLTRTNVDLDTFVYTASHDLKAPITNIESILLALRAQLPAVVQQDELITQLLDMLQGTVTRFQLTIAQLTDVAKLQLAHAGAAEPVLVAQVVEAVRQDLAPLLEEATTQLTLEVAPDLLVSFSPANLRSIVYNLLSNAIKYRAFDRPSQVRVRAEQTPLATVLTVQDNGLGMSGLQQRQLFGLFQRLHTHVEGTGVGLYIVKRLVENGGGTITVQSQPNVGTTFTVTFPHPRA